MRSDYSVINEFMEMVAKSCNPYEGGQVVLDKTLPELIEARKLDVKFLSAWVVGQLPKHFSCGICGTTLFGEEPVLDAESGECCSKCMAAPRMCRP